MSKTIDTIPEVKRVRLVLSWSQVKLAKEMSISQSVISSIENGLVEPSKAFQQRLNKIKKQYKVKV